jgi:hypothetical protein
MELIRGGEAIMLFARVQVRRALPKFSPVGDSCIGGFLHRGILEVYEGGRC